VLHARPYAHRREPFQGPAPTFVRQFRVHIAPPTTTLKDGRGDQ
jgi:hypothetical protein